MKVFVFDADRCNGCANCLMACKDEHCDNDWTPYAQPQKQTGQNWNWIDERTRGQVPKVRVSYVLHLCRHCDDCAVVAAAPECAYRREDGLVVIDPQKAAGRRDLVKACPFGAVSWNDERNLPQKCTGCAHLLDDGWSVPRCVEVCGMGALRFGEEEDFAAELAKSEQPVPVALPGAEGTDPEAAAKLHPRVHYLNLPKRFLGGEVVDLDADEVVIGATVTLENRATGELRHTLTDEFGDFWFKQIEAANYTVYFEKEGYLARKVDASTVKEDRNIGTIALFAEQA